MGVVYLHVEGSIIRSYDEVAELLLTANVVLISDWERDRLITLHHKFVLYIPQYKIMSAPLGITPSPRHY